MKEKRNCKVVEDLLPNYIEKLTNEETNKFVEEHLNECTDCKKTLENMKKDVDLNAPKRNDKEVKYIKKYNKKLKILRNILLVILLIVFIYIGCILRKFLIIKNLQNKADEMAKNNTNYHIRIYEKTGYTEHFKKDNRTATFRYSNWDTEKNEYLYETLIYNQNGNEKVYMKTPKGKTVLLGMKSDVTSILESDITDKFYWALEIKNDNFNLLLLSSKVKIKSKRENGTECYVIDNSPYIIDYDDRYQTFIDKKTGLVMKESDGYRYMYNFDPVDDSIFEEPDISEYTIKYVN